MKYRKKPIVIEAIQYTGSNVNEILAFVKSGTRDIIYCDNDSDAGYFTVKTLEGDMRANVGDYIIRGVSGEFYPCKPDIFEKTYEPVGD